MGGDMKLKPFKEIPKQQWPVKRNYKIDPARVFQSATYFVQVFDEPNGVTRLSVNLVKRKGSKWADGITWDELQAIKSAIGYGSQCAVEIYPEDNKIVNVANMRHLFILPERPLFAW